MPVDRLSFSFSAVLLSLVMTAVAVAEPPGDTVSMKYGAATPLLAGAGVMPNCPLPPASAAPANGAEADAATAVSAAVPVSRTSSLRRQAEPGTCLHHPIGSSAKRVVGPIGSSGYLGPVTGHGAEMTSRVIVDV